MQPPEEEKFNYTVTFDIDDPEIDDTSCDRLTLYLPEGFKREIWRHSQLIHRHDGPAITLRDENSVIRMTEYFRHGQRHRDGDLPAVEYFDDQGRLYGQEWFFEGAGHRDLAPAVLRCAPDGVIVEDRWMQKGRSHRIGGPSHILLDEQSRVIIDEHYHENGVFHRLDGPATIMRDRWTGRTVEQKFYIQGQKINPQQLPPLNLDF